MHLGISKSTKNKWIYYLKTAFEVVNEYLSKYCRSYSCTIKKRFLCKNVHCIQRSSWNSLLDYIAKKINTYWARCISVGKYVSWDYKNARKNKTHNRKKYWIINIPSLCILNFELLISCYVPLLPPHPSLHEEPHLSHSSQISWWWCLWLSRMITMSAGW